MHSLPSFLHLPQGGAPPEASLVNGQWTWLDSLIRREDRLTMMDDERLEGCRRRLLLIAGAGSSSRWNGHTEGEYGCQANGEPLWRPGPPTGGPQLSS